MHNFTLPTTEDIERIAGGGAIAPHKEKKGIRRRFTARTPAGKRSSTWISVIHNEDPKEAIQKRVGDLPNGLIHGCRILVAVYVPPVVTKTEGGIHIAPSIQESDIEEAIWQGRVGLCIAMGPDAYVDTDDVSFSQKINIGDWVWFRPSDGAGCDVGEVFCRVFDSERYIIGKLPHPDMVA